MEGRTIEQLWDTRGATPYFTDEEVQEMIIPASHLDMRKASRDDDTITEFLQTKREEFALRELQRTNPAATRDDLPASVFVPMSDSSIKKYRKLIMPNKHRKYNQNDD